MTIPADSQSGVARQQSAARRGEVARAANDIGDSLERMISVGAGDAPASDGPQLGHRDHEDR